MSSSIPHLDQEPAIRFSDDELLINRPNAHRIHHRHVKIDLSKAAILEEPDTQQLPMIRAAGDQPPPPPLRHDELYQKFISAATISTPAGNTETLERPPDFYPTMELPSSSAAEMAGNRVIHLSPSTGRTPKGEREAVDELLLILVDCLDELSTRSREALLLNFFSHVERDDRLQNFIVERLKQSKVQALTDLYNGIPPEIKADAAAVEGDEMPPALPMMKSVVESTEELTDKLWARFKVRILDFEEDEEAKDDQSQNKPPQQQEEDKKVFHFFTKK